jgi:hypothetical protein
MPGQLDAVVIRHQGILCNGTHSEWHLLYNPVILALFIVLHARTACHACWLKGTQTPAEPLVAAQGGEDVKKVAGGGRRAHTLA